MEGVDKLIDACRRNDANAQQQVYDMFAPKMYGICLRYLKNVHDAEDVLVEGFFKIFTKIHQYSGDGSFEGWIKRIMVNESLMHLRKTNNFRMHVNIDTAHHVSENALALDNLSHKELLVLIQSLPPGYRTVFNMYVIEGYKHREIAEILGISINTSKSQLILAKKKLRDMLKKKHNQKFGS